MSEGVPHPRSHKSARKKANPDGLAFNIYNFLAIFGKYLTDSAEGITS